MLWVVGTLNTHADFTAGRPNGRGGLVAITCVSVFYWQIFDPWGTLLGAKNNHSQDMRFILVWVPGK